MKTYKNLYPEICDFINLYYAYRSAARGKRGRADVAAFEFNLESNLLRLRDELLGHAYRPGGYRHFTTLTPKRRKVSAAPFRDRVVHHALVRVIEPIFERRFPNWLIASLLVAPVPGAFHTGAADDFSFLAHSPRPGGGLHRSAQ